VAVLLETQVTVEVAKEVPAAAGSSVQNLEGLWDPVPVPSRKRLRHSALPPRAFPALVSQNWLIAKLPISLKALLATPIELLELDIQQHALSGNTVPDRRRVARSGCGHHWPPPGTTIDSEAEGGGREQLDAAQIVALLTLRHIIGEAITHIWSSDYVNHHQL